MIRPAEQWPRPVRQNRAVQTLDHDGHRFVSSPRGPGLRDGHRGKNPLFRCPAGPQRGKRLAPLFPAQERRRHDRRGGSLRRVVVSRRRSPPPRKPPDPPACAPATFPTAWELGRTFPDPAREETRRPAGPSGGAGLPQRLTSRALARCQPSCRKAPNGRGVAGARPPGGVSARAASTRRWRARAVPRGGDSGEGHIRRMEVPGASREAEPDRLA